MECDDIAVGGCEVEDASMWMVRVTGSGQVWRSVEEGLFPLSRWALMADSQLLTSAVRLTESIRRCSWCLCKTTHVLEAVL